MSNSEDNPFAEIKAEMDAQSLPKDTTNIRGDPVASGMWVCNICKKDWPSDLMMWTDGPVKLCLACYYDL